MTNESADDPLFLCFESAVSERTALVADEGDSVWLYLTRPGATDVERDCWLFNKPSAARAPDFSTYEAADLPPPAPADIIVPGGVSDVPDEEHWSVRWSEDGETVAVAIDEVEIGVVSASEPRGFARYLSAASPWGNPWDPALLKQLF